MGPHTRTIIRVWGVYYTVEITVANQFDKNDFCTPRNLRQVFIFRSSLEILQELEAAVFCYLSFTYYTVFLSTYVVLAFSLPILSLVLWGGSG